jgi:preprotein translocase subunit YajC
MIRPQVKRQKELANYRNQLKKGDKVITTGGIYGRIHELPKVAIPFCSKLIPTFHFV